MRDNGAYGGGSGSSHILFTVGHEKAMQYEGGHSVA